MSAPFRLGLDDLFRKKLRLIKKVDSNKKRIELKNIHRKIKLIVNVKSKIIKNYKKRISNMI